MNALQLGLFQAKTGLVGPYVKEFLDRWADGGDPETALDAMSPHGRKRVAEWAKRGQRAAEAVGAGDDLCGEFEMLAEAASAEEPSATPD